VQNAREKNVRALEIFSSELESDAVKASLCPRPAMNQRGLSDFCAALVYNHPRHSSKVFYKESA
jgi:hypothetical protein